MWCSDADAAAAAARDSCNTHSSMVCDPRHVLARTGGDRAYLAHPDDAKRCSALEDLEDGRLVEIGLVVGVYFTTANLQRTPPRPRGTASLSIGHAGTTQVHGAHETVPRLRDPQRPSMQASFQS